MGFVPCVTGVGTGLLSFCVSESVDMILVDVTRRFLMCSTLVAKIDVLLVCVEGMPKQNTQRECICVSWFWRKLTDHLGRFRGISGDSLCISSSGHWTD